MVVPKFINREALQRGTSIFLPTAIYPMFPEKFEMEGLSLKQGTKCRQLQYQLFCILMTDGVFVVEGNGWDLRTCQWQSVEADIKRSRDMVANEYVSQAVIEHDDAIQHAEEISKKKYPQADRQKDAHQAHPNLNKTLTKRICCILDCKKFSMEMRTVAVTLRWKLGSCSTWSAAYMTLDKVVDYIKREMNQFFHCS
ncbi:ribonuclease II, chloroplastic/mitochondrial [Tanacetum coccineum]